MESNFVKEGEPNIQNKMDGEQQDNENFEQNNNEDVQKKNEHNQESVSSRKLEEQSKSLNL